MDKYLRITLKIHAWQKIGEIFIRDDRQNHWAVADNFL